MEQENVGPRHGDAAPPPATPPRPAHDNSNSLILSQLSHYLGQVEGQVDGDCLSLISPIDYGVEYAVRETLEARPKKRDKLVVLLETGGGYIEIAQRIADTIRHHYQRVEYVVPNFAMSAGTVLVMSGDAIWMDYYSVLGPIDPQVQRPGGGMVPALGYLVIYDRLIKRAEKKKLTAAEITYLVTNFHPAELYRYEQARDQSIALLKEWLVKYKFKNWTVTETRRKKVTPKMKADRAEQIARILQDTTRWNSHGRGISMEVLRRDVNLTVDDFGQTKPLLEAIRLYYRLLKDFMAKLGHNGVIHCEGQYRPLL